MKRAFCNLTIILTLISLSACGSLGRKMQRSTPCEIIDGQMVSGNLAAVFRDYQVKNNFFPNKLEDLIDFVRNQKTGYNESWVEFFESWIIDPYTNENYKYFPIRVEGEIIDYVLYSVGPNKTDDNLNELLAYDKGEKDRIVFRDFPFDCEVNRLKRSKKKADIVVRLPGRALNEVFFIEFIDP